MTRVAGVLDNFYGLPLTPLGIEVLDSRKLGHSDDNIPHSKALKSFALSIHLVSRFRNSF
jgi:hypothetical protein